MAEDKIAQEIEEKIEEWEKGASSLLDSFEEQADSWRMLSSSRPKDLSGLSSTVTSETTRAVETLATTIHRMMTAQDPPFYLVPQQGDVLPEMIAKNSGIHEWQMERLDYKRKLLKALRSLCLFGTVVVEESWSQWPVRTDSPMYEGTDFQPLSLLQFAFDPSVSDIEMSDWCASIRWVTPEKLREMARTRQDIHPETGQPLWDIDAVEQVIESGKSDKNVSPRVLSRRSKAGYSDRKDLYQIVNFWGISKAYPDRDWCIATVNGQAVVAAYPSHLGSIKPFRVARLQEFELEPYGYGVGRMGKRLKRDLDRNRRLLEDCLTFNLYSMWKANRLAGIKPSQLRVRPWGLIETDDMDGLEQVKTDLNSVQMGLKLEEVMKDEFRHTVGAPPNLQAAITESSATEVVIAQNEIIRRVSVNAEIIADELLRRHLLVSHRNNLLFLDRSFWIQVAGTDRPQLVSPSDMLRDVDFRVRVVTDKDFRPQRLKNLLTYLQTVTSFRNALPPSIDMGSVVLPILTEIARAHGFQPPRQKTEVEMQLEAMQQAKQLAAGGGVGQVASEAELGEAQIQTPVGPVSASPNSPQFTPQSMNGVSP